MIKLPSDTPINIIRADCVKNIATYEDTVIICSSSPEKYTEYAQNQNVLLLSFFDTEIETRPDAFTSETAQQIINFLSNRDLSAGSICVCCDYAHSRSPAIAAALMLTQGTSDSVIWEDRHYRPNALVYRKMCSQLDISKDMMYPLDLEQ